MVKPVLFQLSVVPPVNGFWGVDQSLPRVYVRVRVIVSITGREGR